MPKFRMKGRVGTEFTAAQLPDRVMPPDSEIRQLLHKHANRWEMGDGPELLILVQLEDTFVAAQSGDWILEIDNETIVPLKEVLFEEIFEPAPLRVQDEMEGLPPELFNKIRNDLLRDPPFAGEYQGTPLEAENQVAKLFEQSTQGRTEDRDAERTRQLNAALRSELEAARVFRELLDHDVLLHNSYTTACWLFKELGEHSQSEAHLLRVLLIVQTLSRRQQLERQSAELFEKVTSSPQEVAEALTGTTYFPQLPLLRAQQVSGLGITIHVAEGDRFEARAEGYESGVGSSPDEAIGNLVREVYLSEDVVVVEDISSAEEDESHEDS